MKLTLLLLTATFLQVSAATYAQKVTLKVKKASIREVFEKIQAQTQYDFLYNVEDLKDSHSVTLKLDDVPLKEALDLCFHDQPLSYIISNTSILITKRLSQPAPAVQQVTITGTVTDTTNLPLPGVTVREKNTSNAVVTDLQGKYSITVAENATLEFSFIGFTTVDLPVSGGLPINVRMKENNTALSEVVVVGYGTQKRSNINGAVSTVDAKDIGGKPNMNTLQSLQGESPNLIIQQSVLDPGSTPVVNIRGVGTTGDNSPLVVIDGIVMQGLGNLTTLNPNDIANVTILKDAGSAAIYGSRSANGVILITTKSGKLHQKPTVNYSGNYGVQVPDILVHKVDAANNAYYKNEALVNSGLPPAYTPDQIQEIAAQGRGTWDINHLLYNAPMTSQNINITGGSENSSYFVGAGYQNQLSNFVGNGGSGSKFGYQKYNLRVNQSTVIGKFKFNAILNYTKSRNKTNTSGDNNIFADANRVPSNYNWQDANGNYLTNPVSSQFNQLGILENGGYNQFDGDEIFGNLNGTLTITKGLKLTGVFGGTLDNNGNFYRDIEQSYLPQGVSGDDRTVSDNNTKTSIFNTQVYLDYTKAINRHHLHGTFGVSSEAYNSRGFNLSEKYTDPLLGTATTGTIINTSSATDIGVDASSLLSAFGRINYDYDNKYFLDFVFRDDASSKFAKGHRASFFPSVNAGWQISEEPFMQSLKNTISNLKLKASYGVLGNQNVANYQYETTYFNYAVAYGFNNVLYGGAGTYQSNPLITWERAATFNLGLDFGLFNDQLYGSVNYFNKVTSDILQTPTDVPSLFGATPANENVAKVKDHGWEAELTYTLRTGKVTQSFSGNISDNQNKVLKLTGNTTEQIYNEDVFQLIRRVGSPITEYYGYKTNGYFESQAEINSYPKPAGAVVGLGDVKFKDLNGDGKIDDNDKTLLGDPFPRYTFGFTYRISYGGFDLSAFIQGVGKRNEFLRGELVEPFQANYGATLYDHQTDFWTPENTDARFPRLAIAGSASNTNNWQHGSDLFSFNAAYARLKNLTIGYTIPSKLVAKAGIKKLRIYLTGQNLITLTKLKFVDPELTEFGNNVGFTYSTSARSYLLPVFYGGGIDLTFQ
ncbi:MAG TPA: TonB-dependent receptor [Mucilaginibacter sp.]|nr:TonB-dependent receptor [Mucilaginibacter sp.]